LRLAFLHRFRGLLNGGDDSGMRSTAADVSLQGLSNFRSTWIRVFLQQRDAADDHSGSAISALKRALIDKSLLNGMELAVLFESFNGDDGFSRRVTNLKLARSPRGAIQQNGAGATLTFTATVLDSSQAKLLAQRKKQRAVRLGCKRASLSVYLYLYWPSHPVLEASHAIGAMLFGTSLLSSENEDKSDTAVFEI
jgi:hypothetical protein